MLSLDLRVSLKDICRPDRNRSAGRLHSREYLNYGCTRREIYSIVCTDMDGGDIFVLYLLLGFEFLRIELIGKIKGTPTTYLVACHYLHPVLNEMG